MLFAVPLPHNTEYAYRQEHVRDIEHRKRSQTDVVRYAARERAFPQVAQPPREEEKPCPCRFGHRLFPPLYTKKKKNTARSRKESRLREVEPKSASAIAERPFPRKKQPHTPRQQKKNGYKKCSE